MISGTSFAVLRGWFIISWYPGFTGVPQQTWGRLRILDLEGGTMVRDIF